MRKTGDATTEIRDDAVEVLLEQAAPRPVPPAADEQAVRAAVRAEWHQVSGKRRRLRQFTRYAVAASVLLGVALTFNILRTNGVAPQLVASIDKPDGQIYVLGEQSEWRDLPDMSAVVAGQTIMTGADAGLGLVWNSGGGSLRVDENTTVEFTSATSIYLRSGRIYFDSLPLAAISSGSAPSMAAITGSGRGGPDLVVHTDLGDVVHLGTQYMAAVDRDALTISVREGIVEVDGRHKAQDGQQLRVAGSGSATVADFGRSGEAWAWVEAVAPQMDFSGRPTDEFLGWVGRQTGYTVEYADPDAERIARQGELRGDIPDVDPRTELRMRMAGEDLYYRFDDAAGKIIVSAIDAGS